MAKTTTDSDSQHEQALQALRKYEHWLRELGITEGAFVNSCAGFADGFAAGYEMGRLQGHTEGWEDAFAQAQEQNR